MQKQYKIVRPKDLNTKNKVRDFERNVRQNIVNGFMGEGGMIKVIDLADKSQKVQDMHFFIHGSMLINLEGGNPWVLNVQLGLIVVNEGEQPNQAVAKSAYCVVDIKKDSLNTV